MVLPIGSHYAEPGASAQDDSDGAVNVQPGTTYIEPGATAMDDAGNSLGIGISGSVGTAIGAYSISYTATDSRYISSTAIRTVYVSRWQEAFNVSAKDISIGPDGTMRAVTSTGTVTTLTSEGWKPNYNLGGASCIAVDADGLAWVVLQDNRVFRMGDFPDGSGWGETDRMARDIDVGADGTLRYVQSDGQIFSRTAQGWQE
jgi:Bacterial surface protein, Ig-like domain